MDNITHSLVGVALADALTRGGAARSERRIALGAGLIAANLPDIDLTYSGIAPQPLGYLLHHRGHTHTVLGLIGLALVLILAYRFVLPVRQLRPADRIRLWSLIAIALASHLLLDTLNSYGVHPFPPFDSTWYYGDAMFIFEPWVWLVLGIAVAWNARSKAARLAAVLPIVILPLTMVSMGIIPSEASASLAVVGLPLAWITHRMSPRGRAGVGLTATVVIIAALVGASRVARSAVGEALQPELRGRLVDIILTPNPSSPLCWAAIGIELDEGGGEYVLWRGTLSLAPQWKAPTACASHRFAAARELRSLGDGGPFALRDEIHQPLPRLRDLAQRDCWTRAWLQFGRAPVIAGGSIFDLRFAERVGQNFTHMRLEAGREGCPPSVPRWGTPRADLIDRRSGE